MRRGAVGVGPLIAALEFAHRNEVPAAEWDSPAVRALTEMVIAVVALDNDRQSIVKELRLGQTEQNVFTALMGEGLSLEEAIAEATALRDRAFWPLPAGGGADEAGWQCGVAPLPAGPAVGDPRERGVGAHDPPVPR